MCGIVGILGRHEVAPLILEALKRLEYRGYDSAGIATLQDGRLARRRAVGKLIALSDLLVQDPIRGHAGIGHTRWATHGAPTERNAHPHQAGRGRGGAQRHHRELPRAARRARGRGRGLRDRDRHRDHRPALRPRARRAASRRSRPPAPRWRGSHGAFALCFLFDGEEDLLVAARRGSPLAIGYGEGEVFVGSDALALAPLTHRIAYLEEGDHAVLTRDVGRDLRRRRPRRSTREIHHVPVENFYAEKGPYKHFMAKEMHEQPTVIADALARYLTPDRKAAAAAGRHRLRRLRPAGAGRLRHRALRLPRGEVLVRDARPAAGRDRGRLGVPLPRAAARRRHARHLRQPVRRDRRHPGGAALRARPGRAHRLGGQRRDLDHRARERRGAADPRRPRDRRRLDQGLHLPAHRAGHAGARRRPPARPPRRRRARSAWPPRSAARPASSRARWPLEPEIAEIARDLVARAGRALPRAAARCIRWRWKAR